MITMKSTCIIISVVLQIQGAKMADTPIPTIVANVCALLVSREPYVTNVHSSTGMMGNFIVETL